jgi:hypothetical protein
MSADRNVWRTAQKPLPTPPTPVGVGRAPWPAPTHPHERIRGDGRSRSPAMPRPTHATSLRLSPPARTLALKFGGFVDSPSGGIKWMWKAIGETGEFAD